MVYTIRSPLAHQRLTRIVLYRLGWCTSCTSSMITDKVLIHSCINSFELLNGFFDSLRLLNSIAFETYWYVYLRHWNKHRYTHFTCFIVFKSKYLIGVFQFMDKIYITNIHRAFVWNEFECIPLFLTNGDRGDICVCVHACVRVCVCVRACVRVCVCVNKATIGPDNNGLSDVQRQTHVVVAAAIY